MSYHSSVLGLQQFGWYCAPILFALGLCGYYLAKICGQYLSGFKIEVDGIFYLFRLGVIQMQQVFEDLFIVRYIGCISKSLSVCLRTFKRCSCLLVWMLVRDWDPKMQIVLFNLLVAFSVMLVL